MKNALYKWYLSTDGETLKEFLPVYKGDLAIDYELESGEVFHRAKLSGKIDIVGNDYDWVMAQPFNTKYHVLLYSSFDNGENYTEHWHGTFVRTDCEVNVDDKKIIVQPQVLDRYTNVLQGIETEYDLIKDLSPVRSSITAQKSSYMQVLMGSWGSGGMNYASIVNNVKGSMQWSEDIVNDVTEDNDYDTNKFGMSSFFSSGVITKAMDGDGYYPAIDVEGTYVGVVRSWDSDGQKSYIYCPDVDGYLIYIFAQNSNVTASLMTLGGEVLYSGTKSSSGAEYYPYTIDLSPADGMVGKLQLNLRRYAAFTRMLTDTLAEYVTIDGEQVLTYDRVAGDATAYTLNYKKVVPLGVAEIYDLEDLGLVAISARYSDTFVEGQTIYGQNGDDEYLLPPSDSGLYLPVGESWWSGRISFWAIPQGTRYESATRAYALPDAYSIQNVISSLLGKIDTDITHSGTTDYSQFLYGTNPISELTERLYITPKSNAITTEYSQAAQKGKITLKILLDMLKRVFQCYWYIDDDNRLCIEHIKYFVQGKSYVADANITGTDLTALYNASNGKQWDFGKNTYTFEKYNIPERYVFEWMDEVSEIFMGSPIVFSDVFAEKGRKEEFNVSNFTSDLDYMIRTPDQITKDGFALLAATPSNSVYNGEQYAVTLSTPKILELYSDEYLEPIEITLNSTNSLDAVRFLEYGIYDGTNYTQLGKITSTSTAQDFTISVTPTDTTFQFYMRPSSTSAATDILTANIVSITGGRMNVSQTTITRSGISFVSQNYHLSFEYLLPTFYAYNLPCPNASFNGEDAVTTTLVQRNKTQNVKFPVGCADDPDPEKLVKTSVGIGEVKKLSVTLSSRVASATLKHDLE